MGLEGKVALITGGSSGIGLATATRFVNEGAFVFITGRRETELEKAKAAIGRNVTTVQGDLASLEDLDRLISVIRDEKGGLDMIVSSAGFVQPIPFDQVTPEHYDQTFGVNARGTFFLVQKALPLMRDEGSVVLISSTAHSIGVPIYPTYSASKAAVRSFARTMSANLIERNIRVNVVSPGPVETPIIDVQFPDREIADQVRVDMAGRVPMGRMGNPEEVANAVLFLASDEASYITGADLPVDGGQTQL